MEDQVVEQACCAIMHRLAPELGGAPPAVSAGRNATSAARSVSPLSPAMAQGTASFPSGTTSHSNPVASPVTAGASGSASASMGFGRRSSSMAASPTTTGSGFGFDHANSGGPAVGRAMPDASQLPVAAKGVLRNLEPLAKRFLRLSRRRNVNITTDATLEPFFCGLAALHLQQPLLWEQLTTKAPAKPRGKTLRGSMSAGGGDKASDGAAGKGSERKELKKIDVGAPGVVEVKHVLSFVLRLEQTIPDVINDVREQTARSLGGNAAAPPANVLAGRSSAAAAPTNGGDAVLTRLLEEAETLHGHDDTSAAGATNPRASKGGRGHKSTSPENSNAFLEPPPPLRGASARLDTNGDASNAEASNADGRRSFVDEPSDDAQVRALLQLNADTQHVVFNPVAQDDSMAAAADGNSPLGGAGGGEYTAAAEVSELERLFPYEPSTQSRNELVAGEGFLYAVPFCTEVAVEEEIEALTKAAIRAAKMEILAQRPSGQASQEESQESTATSDEPPFKRARGDDGASSVDSDSDTPTPFDEDLDALMAAIPDADVPVDVQVDRQKLRLDHRVVCRVCGGADEPLASVSSSAAIAQVQKQTCNATERSNKDRLTLEKSMRRDVTRHDALYKCVACKEFIHAACIVPPRRELPHPFTCNTCVFKVLVAQLPSEQLCQAVSPF